MICPNIEDDVSGNSIRDKLLSKYDSMRSSFIVVQADEGRKTKHSMTLLFLYLREINLFFEIYGFGLQCSKRGSYFVCDVTSSQYT